MMNDQRIVDMRRALGEAVEGAARVWNGDAEVVQVSDELDCSSTRRRADAVVSSSRRPSPSTSATPPRTPSPPL